MTITETRIVYLSWLKEHWFQAGILAVSLSFVSPPVYYFLVELPQQQAARAERQQFTEAFQSACLADADNSYDSNWAKACTRFGVSDTGPDCTLPHSNAENVERWHQEATQECFKRTHHQVSRAPH